MGCDPGFVFLFFLREHPDEEQKWTHCAPTWLCELGKSFLVNEFYVFISETKSYPKYHLV